MNKSVRNFRTIFLTTIAMVISVAISFAIAKPGGPKGTKGNYEIRFVGSAFVGTGTAKVNPARVNTIDGDITDTATGAQGKFVAKNLDLNDGRFVGTGTVLGIPVTVSGRVEAADGTTILVPRIICNFSTAGGACGRIVGTQ